MTAPLDTITVLTARGRAVLAKRHRRLPTGGVVTTQYDKAWAFRLSQRPVGSIDDIAVLLRELADERASCIVRGDPALDVDWGKPQKRRLKTRQKTDGTVEPATLVPAARCWLFLDIDGIDCPAGIEQFEEPDRVVEHVIDTLPEAFRGVTCCWQFTGSAGIKPGIRLRLVFWLDRPLADWQLKLWLADSPVDHSIFAPAQPVYTATPIFEGMPDPLPFRSGLWRGHSDAVEVPPIEKPQPRVVGGTVVTGSAGAGYEHYRSQIGDHAEGNGFFHPIKSAVASWIGAHGAGGDTAWLRADLEAAIREAPRDRALHVDGYIDVRVDDLDPLIAAIRDMEAEKEPAGDPADEPVEPTYPALQGKVEDARHKIEAAMKRFAGLALTWLEARKSSDEPDDPFIAYGGGNQDEKPAPVLSVNADLGIGKTLMFVIWVIKVLVEAGYRPVLAVPRHKLGDEIVRQLAEHGVIGRVYRGRNRPDPEDPEGKAKMCRDLDRVKEIESALGDASKHACKHKDKECKFFRVCGYQKQRSEKPHIWLIAHQLLFLQKPSFIKCDALGIDESFYNASLRGTGTRGEEKPVIVDLDDFLGDRKNARNTNPTHNLVDLSRRAHAVLEAHPAGRLSRSTFHAARFVAEDARKAYAAEWERKLEPQVWPSMSARQYKAACAKVAMHNKQVARLARFWRLLEWTLKAPDERSPWMEVWHFVNEKNQTETEISMAWSNDIHKSWLAPTMIMDATMPIEIVRRFFPTMEDPVNATASMPHTVVRQITDRPMAASMLIPSNEASEKENKTRRNNIKKVQRYIEVRAASVRPGRVLVVCQEGLEAELTKGIWSNSIEFRHFNDIAGENAFSDVALLIMIGRTAPSPRPVEKITRAVFGADIVEVLPDEAGAVRYPRVARVIRMRDGTGRKVDGDQHPDPRVDAARWQICEAGLIQTVGRGRGVNRTAGNPLQIDILTNVVLPIEADELTTWDRIQPSLAEVMRARGAVPIAYRDMAAAYPDLFESSDSARMALTRGNPEQTPIERYLIGVCSGFLAVGYRRAGTRGPAARLLYDPARVDPAVWLAERIGEVTILGEPVPVVAEPVAEQPAAAPDPEQQAEDDACLAALEVAAEAIRREPKGRVIPLGVVDPGDGSLAVGLTSERRCRWITDTTGDRIRRCGELILDDLDYCPMHRAQYAEMLLGEPIWAPMPFGPFPTHAPIGTAA